MASLTRLNSPFNLDAPGAIKFFKDIQDPLKYKIDISCEGGEVLDSFFFKEDVYGIADNKFNRHIAFLLIQEFDGAMPIGSKIDAAINYVCRLITRGNQETAEDRVKANSYVQHFYDTLQNFMEFYSESKVFDRFEEC